MDLTPPLSNGSLYHIFIVAGEPSGDFLGAQLMKALKKNSPHKIVFSGIGGPLMQEEGLRSLFPLSELSLIGITENIRKAWGIWRKLQETKNIILQEKPDLLVTIDFPGFNFKLGKALKGSSIPHVHYVAPTVWAWRSSRAKKVSKFLKHLLALFPFEPPYFEKEGLPCTFVGHPLVEVPFENGHAENFRKKHHLDPMTPLICVLPGSRESEIKSHLPVFKETIELLRQQTPKLTVIIPTVEGVSSLVRGYAKNWMCPVIVVEDLQEKKDAYAASRVALAASGTIALELACAQLPMIISYKVSSLTAFLVRRLLKIPFVCMINILLKKEVVPELLQEKCTPLILAQAMEILMKDEGARQKQISENNQAIDLVRPGQNRLPSEVAANVILEILISTR
jgi:lipid-A-disaccharide synthase